jgi:hypothetical protein
MLVKLGIGIPLLSLVVMVVANALFDAIAHPRRHGGGDYLVMGIMCTLISMVGLAAVRGAQRISQTLSEPEPPLPNGTPGQHGNSPAVEVAKLDVLADGTPVSNPNNAGGSKRNRSDSRSGTILIRTGHVIAIFSIGLTIYAMHFYREAGGIAFGFVLALFFYVAGVAVKLLDR